MGWEVKRRGWSVTEGEQRSKRLKAVLRQGQFDTTFDTIAVQQW
jgi:hypothetical protein